MPGEIVHSEIHSIGINGEDLIPFVRRAFPAPERRETGSVHSSIVHPDRQRTKGSPGVNSQMTVGGADSEEVLDEGSAVPWEMNHPGFDGDQIL